MKTIETGHGPIVEFTETEGAKLVAAFKILEKAREIESENGNLHVRNFLDLEIAITALKVCLVNRGELQE